MRKTWTQKLENGRKPEMVRLEKAFGGIAAGGLMLVSTPLEVQAHIERIGEGASLTPAQLRDRLAKKHGANGTCPISTGIFLRIVAEAAWEQIQAGKDPGEVAPFWRVVEPGSPLAKKLTCGDEFVKRMRRQEGIA